MPARAGRRLLPLCLTGLALVYIVDFMSKLNSNAPPWRPEGSGSATRPSEAPTASAHQATSTAKPSGLGSQQNYVCIIASFFPRRNPTSVLSGGPNFMGAHGTADMLGVTPLSCNREEGATSMNSGKNFPPAKVRRNRRHRFLEHLQI